MGGLKISKRGNVVGLNPLLKNQPKAVQRSILKAALDDLVAERAKISRQIIKNKNAKIVVRSPNMVFEESSRVIKGNKRTIKTPMFVEGRLTGKLHVSTAINNLRKQIKK
ncbi:MAG: hypothetical protein HYW05_04130 [Candidatus Diapherotrites archaeon]|nr:hypothetical protein [Candidatus Diapherotrites archaeon]